MRPRAQLAVFWLFLFPISVGATETDELDIRVVVPCSEQETFSQSLREFLERSGHGVSYSVFPRCAQRIPASVTETIFSWNRITYLDFRVMQFTVLQPEGGTSFSFLLSWDPYWTVNSQTTFGLHLGATAVKLNRDRGTVPIMEYGPYFSSRWSDFLRTELTIGAQTWMGAEEGTGGFVKVAGFYNLRQQLADWVNEAFLSYALFSNGLIYHQLGVGLRLSW